MTFSLSPRYESIRKLVVPMLALLLAFTLFSLYTVLMKKAIKDGAPPLLLALLREIIATSVLLPSAYLSERRKAVDQQRFWVDSSDTGSFIMLGAAMIYGVQLLSALALEHLSANTYALLAPTVPVVCLLVAVAMRVEPLDIKTVGAWLKIGSVIVTVTGATYIAVRAYVTHPTTEKGNILVGLALLMTNKVSVATYPVLEKRLMKKYSPLTIVAWGYTYGAFLTALAAIPGATSSLTTGAWKLSTSGWIAILYSSLVSSAFNYSLMAWVNSHSSPVVVMAFYPWQSIATPILAYIILGTPIEADDAMGGIIIILGLGLLMVARYRESKHGQSKGGNHIELQENDEKVPGKDIVSPTIANAAGGDIELVMAAEADRTSAWNEAVADNTIPSTNTHPSSQTTTSVPLPTNPNSTLSSTTGKVEEEEWK